VENVVELCAVCDTDVKRERENDRGQLSGLIIVEGPRNDLYGYVRHSS